MNEKEVEKYIDKLYELENYDVVKKDLFIQAHSKTRDADNWKDGIYCMVGDIVLTVQLKLEETEEKRVGISIFDSFLSLWKKTKEEVLKDAYENTTKMLSVTLIGLDEKEESFFRKEEKPGEITVKGKGQRGYYLGYGSKGLGAAWFFIPGNARRICREIGADEIYVLPLSASEVVIRDVRQTVSVKKLWWSFWITMAANVEANEFLTINIYHYSAKTDKMTMLVPDEETRAGR